MDCTIEQLKLLESGDLFFNGHLDTDVKTTHKVPCIRGMKIIQAIRSAGCRMAINPWNGGDFSEKILVALAIHTNSISIGMSQGFSAVLLPQLESNRSSIQVDSEEASWIASLGVISTPGGALFSGMLAEIVGRKTTIQITALPFLSGWVMMGLSNDKIWLYIGRFVTGFAIGMASTCYVYLAEISLPSERGMLAALGPVFVSFGVLLVYLFGYMMEWHISTVVCAATAAFSFFIIYFLPETPPWLASKAKFSRASDTLLLLRGSKEAAEAEMRQILHSVDCKKGLQYKEYLGQSKKPTVWKPFLILVFFFVFQEGSGMYNIVYYATNIFRDIGPVLDSSVESIIVGVVRLVTSIVGTLCIQNFGRRPMAITSSGIMGLSMAVAAFYNYRYGTVLLEDRPCPYVPFTCLVVNVIASMLGMLQLPWLMIGELFPLSVRGILSGIVSSLGYLFIFIIIKVYPNLMETLNLTGMMTLFSIMSLLTVPYVIFFLPETQGKTLLEIEHSFLSKSASKEEADMKRSPSEANVDPVYILKI
ncbi:facilitated trehalose transporter Tret1 isoform X1 [Halyomorpha halys]|uniref:facilitated trehalose transporter Tret1 isoform X1 n=1 Tax=Halyomorpha halys TaxID=286706 RepID=UPI0006D4CCFA